MKLSIITIIISFILDGIISNIVSLDSYFKPLLTIVSLILIYPFFYNRNEDYLKISIITGLLYDIVYTNTLFLNLTIFFLLARLIIKLNIFITNNIVNVAILSIIIIMLYKIINFFILCIIGYLSIDIFLLLDSILNSLLLNIVFSIIMYIILDRIARKNNIYKID